MNSELGPEIRREVARYLSGEISVEELRDRFVRASPDLASAGEDSALAYGIEHLFAEFSGQLLSESDLRKELHVLVPSYTELRRLGHEQNVFAWSGATTTRSCLSGKLRPVGT
ncbi:MAG: hypothetical protein KatS3mg060_1891 [Dehalococcoidia bacterium]|nr:MAG: hypothetical protein KatS3mg060_1891 [Dehalococcoidia bacterium]